MESRAARHAQHIGFPLLTSKDIILESFRKSVGLRGLSNITMGRALAFHMADPDLIPSILYDLPCTTSSDS